LTGPLGLILLGIAVVVAIGYGSKWYTGKSEPASAPTEKTGKDAAGTGGTVQAPMASGGQQTPAQPQNPVVTEPPKLPADPNQAILAQRSQIDRSAGAKETMLVTVYYADGLKSSDTLAPVQVKVSQSRGIIQTAAEQVVNAPENLKLYSNVPPGTVVRSVDLRDGVAYIDLSAEANQVQGTAAAETMRAAFVYTLTEIKGVNAVQLQVLGHPAMLHGIEWSKPVTRADIQAHTPVQVAPVVKYGTNP
jgi:spore germination protein GerM